MFVGGPTEATQRSAICYTYVSCPTPASGRAGLPPPLTCTATNAVRCTPAPDAGAGECRSGDASRRPPEGMRPKIMAPHPASLANPPAAEPYRWAAELEGSLKDFNDQEA